MTTYKTRRAVQSTHETLARHRKAVKLVALFKSEQFNAAPEQVKALDEAGWITAARMTGTWLASPATRALVCEMLRAPVTV